jgi:hypothetical protein
MTAFELQTQKMREDIESFRADICKKLEIIHRLLPISEPEQLTQRLAKRAMASGVQSAAKLLR